MIQNWIHTAQITTNAAAQSEMRFGRSSSANLCGNFDNPKYQPTLGGLDRLEKKL
ncbi:MAG TPA: hypothetical protein PKY59_22225 [Pyrinomonadaceae bacterium]|nr:hypothetical protein [Pyrinomonadaceae bacterium]